MKIVKLIASATKPSPRIVIGLTVGLISIPLPIHAQQPDRHPAVETIPVLLAGITLPDSPGALRAHRPDAPDAGSSSKTADFGSPASVTQPMASHTAKYIAPGQPTPSLTPGNKFLLGVKEAVSPFSAAGWVVSAGYEQGTNGSPNYGTNSSAFGQRVGAAAARASSDQIFSDAILSGVLHEDPRYYRMGPGHNIFERAAYAATRTLVTRTDTGRATPNFALLGGTLGGSYLTKTYYPPLNQTNNEVLKTFGSSLGGAAVRLVASEFLSSAFNLFHGSKAAGN